jgi:hypothetical protein
VGCSAVGPQTTKHAAEGQTGAIMRSNGVDIVQVHTWNVSGGRDLDQERSHTRLVPHWRFEGEGARGGEGATIPLCRSKRWVSVA